MKKVMVFGLIMLALWAFASAFITIDARTKERICKMEIGTC